LLPDFCFFGRFCFFGLAPDECFDECFDVCFDALVCALWT